MKSRPHGLYSVTELKERINRQYIENGLKPPTWETKKDKGAVFVPKKETQEKPKQ